MRLSIIIIEYHCMHQVQDCIKSIDTYMSDIDKECIVVSNSEYSAKQISEYQNKYSSAKIIDTKNNLGYAGGVNTGIKYATGEYLYVLNPDCIITDENIRNIMDDMDADPKWAIAGPKVVDENKHLQPSCRRFPRPWTFLMVRSFLSILPGASQERKRYLMEDFDHGSVQEVDWVSGGATLVKASTIKEIGGMDERYFLYMEDVDWCRSCWLNGYKVKYNPVSTVIHAGQHQSISGSIINKLQSKHVRMHLNSMFKYFLKYSFKRNY